MEFPKTHEGLIDAGYTYGGVGKCRACSADMLWYKTPSGKSIPLDVGTFIAHFSTCPNAADFRKSTPAKQERDRF